MKFVEIKYFFGEDDISKMKEVIEEIRLMRNETTKKLDQIWNEIQHIDFKSQMN